MPEELGSGEVGSSFLPPELLTFAATATETLATASTTFAAVAIELHDGVNRIANADGQLVVSEAQARQVWDAHLAARATARAVTEQLRHLYES